MTTGKTIALTIRNFVGKVISLFFNTLARFGIAFLPRSKHLLYSWLWSPSAVILEPKKIVSHCFHCFPICLPPTSASLTMLNKAFDYVDHNKLWKILKDLGIPDYLAAS